MVFVDKNDECSIDDFLITYPSLYMISELALFQSHLGLGK